MIIKKIICVKYSLTKSGKKVGLLSTNWNFLNPIQGKIAICEKL